MSIGAGTRLGPYEMLDVIGAGGMGVVYRARDTRLDRTVAIKVLPPEVSGDGERRERFQREARTLAALSHPRVCPLFDVGEHDGSLFLVMEHLDGETLAKRLHRGALPVREALGIAIEIAEGLAAAHARGIVHRDLKPGNVMLTRSGARVLDFGLARPRAGLNLGPETPTETAPLTEAGAVLGTMHYMSPEQLDGRDVDIRADIWALGVILYEMVAGVRPFAGDNSARVMAAILEHEPRPLAEVALLAPVALDRLVRRCLAKCPDERWDSARDLAAALRWVVQEPVRAPARRTADPARAWWLRAARSAGLVGASVLATAGAFSLLPVRRPPAHPKVVRAHLDVRPADEVRSALRPHHVTRTPGGSRTAFAWTPDGRALVFVGTTGGVRRLFLRQLDADAATPIPGTEGGHVPVVSADGRWVAFWADGAIRKVALAGGPASVVAAGVAFAPRGMDLGASGLLVFEDMWTIWRAGDDSGKEAVTALGDGEFAHVNPHLLPGDSVLLFVARRRWLTWGDEEVVAQDLATGERKVLLRGATDVRFLPSGHLLLLRSGALLAVAFDPRRLELSGEPVAVLGPVAQALVSGNTLDLTGAGQVAVSARGDLAYIASPPVALDESRLVAVDREGRVEPLPAPHRPYLPNIAAAPDGRRLAVGIESATEIGVWSYDLTRHTLTRVSPTGGEHTSPAWTPDGTRISFVLIAGGRLTLGWQQADGAAPLATLAPDAVPRAMELGACTWSRDGRHLVYVMVGKQRQLLDLDLTSDPARSRPVLQTSSSEQWPALSADGRWLAYSSVATGRYEVYVQPFPGPGARVQVSLEGGDSPAWNPNGREIFFIESDPSSLRRRMMAVDFAPGTNAELATPRRLFEFDASDLQAACQMMTCYAVSSDGRRFYTTQSVKAEPPPPVTRIDLILNWRAELEAKVPSRR